MSNNMKLISLQCPHCNATIEVQDGLDTFYCNYCGNKIMLDGMSDAAYQAKVQIKGMEHEERMQAMEYAEHEKKLKSLYRFYGGIFIILAFLLVISILMVGISCGAI